MHVVHSLDLITLQYPLQLIITHTHQQARDECYHDAATCYEHRLPWSQIVGAFQNVINRVQLNTDVHVDCR